MMLKNHHLREKTMKFMKDVGFKERMKATIVDGQTTEDLWESQSESVQMS